MPEEMRKQSASAIEWMEFYEKLFEEKNPVNGTPLPIEETTEKPRKEGKT